MILLSAQNLSKTYLERTVLDDVSFFLNEGDRVGIVGINGTGQSTLLRILAGVEEPDSGTAPKASGFLTCRKFQILQNMAASWNKSWHTCRQI